VVMTARKRPKTVSLPMMMTDLCIMGDNRAPLRCWSRRTNAHRSNTSAWFEFLSPPDQDCWPFLFRMIRR
jgi:hypothetical protein